MAQSENNRRARLRPDAGRPKHWLVTPATGIDGRPDRPFRAPRRSPNKYSGLFLAVAACSTSHPTTTAHEMQRSRDGDGEFVPGAAPEESRRQQRSRQRLDAARGGRSSAACRGWKGGAESISPSVPETRPGVHRGRRLPSPSQSAPTPDLLACAAGAQALPPRDMTVSLLRIPLSAGRDTSSFVS